MSAPAVPEIAYCDTMGLGLALRERSPRLERSLKADATALYAERDEAERVLPPIVVGGRTYRRRIRIQRPGQQTIDHARRLVRAGTAVVLRLDLARDVTLPSAAEAEAVQTAVRERVVLRWCSTPLRVVGEGWYLGVAPGEEGAILVGYAGSKAAAEDPGTPHTTHLELRLHGARVVAAAVGRALTNLDRAWTRLRFHPCAHSNAHKGAATSVATQYLDPMLLKGRGRPASGRTRGYGPWRGRAGRGCRPGPHGDGGGGSQRECAAPTACCCLGSRPLG